MFNLASTTQLSMLLFSGVVKEKVPRPVLNELGVPVQIKSGKNRGQYKTKLVEVERVVKGLGLKPRKDWETKRKGIYSTNDKVLKSILQAFQQEKEKGLALTSDNKTMAKYYDAAKIAELILRLRNKSKQLSTYYNDTYIYPDGMIRTQFQQVLTPTGRISSKDPNLQNIPGKKSSKAKQHFVSRFPGGQILNSDYSQIEIMVFAILSNDIILLDILLQGIDLYRYLASYIYSKPMEEISKDSPERKSTKVPALGIIYGNGAKTLSQNCGQDEKWCKTFIQTFYELFPVAKQWHQTIQEVVAETGRLQVFTGQEFVFQKKPSKFEWQFEQGILESYNPPDIKNHPVQGTAFIFLIIMLGKFWREKALLNRNKYLLINTVHDSVMLDVRKEYVNEAIKDLELLANVKEMCYKLFKTDIKLDIKQDISMGNSWYDLEEVKS